MKRITTDHKLINNTSFTNRLSKSNGKILLKLVKEFMLEYYQDVKLIDNDLLLYRVDKKQPDKFSWYQVTIEILPNFITERFEHNYKNDSITMMETAKYMSYGKQLSLILISGRIDGIHNRWESFNPIIVLDDYVKQLKKYGIL